MIITKEQRNAIALLMVASDRTKIGNFDLEDEQNARTILRAMIDSSGKVGTPPEEAEWKSDLEVLDRGTRSGLIDIEIAKMWHVAYRKAQNSNLLRKQENERLQASLIDLHAEYINTLEKNPGCSAWDLDEQSDADQRRLRKNAAHAISIVEPPIYLQADQQATLTKSLKKEIRRLKHESKVEQELTNSYIKHLHEAEARIKELEDALVEERARGNHYGMSYEDAVGDGEFKRWIIGGEKDLPKIYLDRVRAEAKRQIQADGKIGPEDAA